MREQKNAGINGSFLRKIAAYFRRMLGRRLACIPASDSATTAVICSPDIYVAASNKSKGIGMFAARDFSAGELIERCPVLVIEEPRYELSVQLRTIVLDWRAVATTEMLSAIALGYGSVYNSARPANLRCDVDAERSHLLFITTCPVPKDTELTVAEDGVCVSQWSRDEWIADQ
jgi:hypothetical protein